MLKLYIVVAVILFIAFVVKYMYECSLECRSSDTVEEKLIIVGDILKRLGAAAVWLPIAVYYVVVFRNEIVDIYRKVFRKC